MQTWKKMGAALAMAALAFGAQPVMAAHGLSGLDPAFPRAVRDALRIVAEDPEGDAFLEKWAALEAQYRQPLW